jgi:hypothetical protein
VHTFGDDRNSQLYLNGEPLTDGQWTDDSGAVIDGNAPYIPNSGKPYWIGRLGLEEIYFTGSIDEIRIWNVARSGSEIEAAMTTELTGGEEGLVAYWRIGEASDSGKILGAFGNDGILQGDAQIEAITDLDDVHLQILESSSESGVAQETIVESVSVDGNDANSPCDFTLDNVGETAAVSGTIGFIDENSPGFWYAELMKDGCKLGIVVNTALHGGWFDQVPQAFEMGASLLVEGHFVSYPYPNNPDELQLILELDEQPQILSPDG